VGGACFPFLVNCDLGFFFSLHMVQKNFTFTFFILTVWDTGNVKKPNFNIFYVQSIHSGGVDRIRVDGVVKWVALVPLLGANSKRATSAHVQKNFLFRLKICIEIGALMQYPFLKSLFQFSKNEFSIFECDKTQKMFNVFLNSKKIFFK